jgi:transposase
VVLAEDEASLYLQATTMRVWVPRGQEPVVTADPGRAKTSFYGTLNLHTGAEIVMQSEKMNAETTAQHLEQILAAHPDVPLLLVWDRAPWHRGEAIRAVLAANPRLEIVQFPVAAPDLNPQEHVWKATRGAVSHNHTDRQLSTLAARFKAHLTDTAFPTSFLEHRGFYTVHPRFI